jgi:hypothetical protein
MSAASREIFGGLMALEKTCLMEDLLVYGNTTLYFLFQSGLAEHGCVGVQLSRTSQQSRRCGAEMRGRHVCNREYNRTCVELVQIVFIISVMMMFIVLHDESPIAGDDARPDGGTVDRAFGG